MAEGTPPSHQARHRLAQGASAERPRRRRPHPGKRERQAASQALIAAPATVPDPGPALPIDQARAVLPAWFLAGEIPSVDELDAVTPEQSYWMELHSSPKGPDGCVLSLFEQQMAVSESLGMDVSDLRRQHAEEQRQQDEAIDRLLYPSFDLPAPAPDALSFDELMAMAGKPPC
jgi:hypothetical protein